MTRPMSESSQNAPMKLSNYRHKKILEMLSQRQSVSADELSAEFGVSKITIRRDLDALATHK
ncbi:MAG: DeoR family transcriptional regulator, partial [Rhodoferax sp.]